MNRVIGLRAFPFCLAIVFSVNATPVHASPPNVLFIAVDDLRPELNCYGAKHIRSPNIDRLAATGRRFDAAYCQQAVCNPSRTSLMTGLRPDTTGVTGNHSHFRSRMPDVVTLPQHFRNHGYHAHAIGKLYHGVFPDGASITKWDTMGDPESWSTPAIRFGPRYYYTEDGIAAAKATFNRVYKPMNPGPDDWTQKLVFGPATESPDVPDETLYDGQVADSAIDALHRLQQYPESPFFLGVGFIKPHSPYVAPKKYFDMYPDVSLTTDIDFPENAPGYAGHNSGELRRYTDQPGRGSIPHRNQRRVRQAYYACVSYIDAQIGRVLDELDLLGLADNTIVCLYGDHGYHLGEHGLWGKTTNFELDTRVPLIIRVPQMKSAGKASSSLVELIDLYPTLAELAGLPVGDHLEGTSLVSLLNDPTATVKPAAISQYPRSGGLMGYSMRTPTHRLTQWVERESGDIKATELYEYADGPIERKNLADDSPRLARQLSDQLAALWPQSFVGRGSGTRAAKTSQVVKPARQIAKRAKPIQVTVRPDSFEIVPAGPFKNLASKLGLWSATTGTTSIDNRHAATGKQCLHLSGGEQTTVELLLDNGVKSDGHLTFRAERWTKREPFSFRIEKQVGDQWSEIYNGDDVIRVGRPFLSEVDVDLNDPSIRRLRFSVTSPENTGILIDDLRIAPARPQQIVSVENVPFALPALVGADQCPLLKLKIETSGRLTPIRLTELRAALTTQTKAADIETLQAFVGRSGGSFSTVAPFGDATRSSELVGTGSHALAEGDNYLWLAATLSKDANIDRRIGATCESVSFSDGTTIDLQPTPSIQNLGVSVRNAGDDGVHTYRIPGLATTKAGSLVAVYDVRRRGGGDLPGDIDVGMSRSTDGGRSWQPMQIIMDMGDDPNFRYDGIGDPTVMVDKTTGTVWCAATWSHGNRSWVGSQPGLTPEETGQFMLVRSDDDGVTWSQPMNITSQIKKPEWSFILQGPGKGITMSDGTLVLPAQYQDPPNPANRQANRLPHSTFIYSRDHGSTWQTATGAWDDTTESQVVELADGQLMLNCRNNRISRRAILTTSDMGSTWKQHPSHNRSLIEPGTCMASLINVGRELRQLGLDSEYSKRNDVLLFSNPDSLKGRNHITIKASLDGGRTWPAMHHLLLDEQRGAGYSCMTMIDADTVGIIYEGSQAHMTFQRIKLADILNPPKNQKTKNPAVTAIDTENAAAIQNSSAFGFAKVFSDHMVLQADQPIRVWGKARPGATVTVGFSTDDRLKCTAGQKGRWQVELPAQYRNSNPQVLTAASDGTSHSLHDVLIGEVWLCAGQSNMEWPLRQSDGGQQAIVNSHDTQLRLMSFSGAARGGSGVYSPEMADRLTPGRFSEGVWEVAGPNSSADFSAVGFYFGRQLRFQLDCPIGIVDVSIGGTPIEAWIDRVALAKHPTLQQMVRGNWLDNPALDEWCRGRAKANLRRGLSGEFQLPGDDFGPNHSFKPGFMHGAAIAQFAPMSVRGALWYQGESNADTPERIRQYDAAFPVLVKTWRKAFQNADLPIGFVQLPAMGRPHWPMFREYQRRSLDKLDNVGMAVTIDTGNRTNVHPKEKRTVAERLADWAMGHVYDSPGVATGPLFESMQVSSSILKLTFQVSHEKMATSDGRAPNNFEVAGVDGVFHPATAELSGREVWLTSSKVSDPVNARYAWADFPEPKPNLVNTSGLPASPFTTEAEIPDGQPPSEDDRPNILLIVSEDNGPELGCYGDRYATTPNIDAFAAESIRFKTAYVTQAVCSSSRSSLLTGMYPHQNGQIGLATHDFRMFKAWPTTYSILKQAGYTTGMIGKLHVNPTRVVEDYIDYRAIRSSNFAKKNLGDYAQHSAAFINGANKPFFLTVNFPDAHWPVQNQVEGRPAKLLKGSDVRPMPYVAFDNERLRSHVQGFYNCMTRLDECVGELLQVLEESGKGRNTLVIYIGDHGAQFARGKVYVTEGGLRIPFIVRWPGKVKEGYASDQMVSTIDILPTIVTAARAKVPTGLAGKDLTGVLGGNENPIREYLFGERNTDAAVFHYPQRAIRDAQYKLIKTLLPEIPDPGTHRYLTHALSNFRGSPTYDELKTASGRTQHIYSQWLHPPEYQLFDLQADPSEFTNLAEDASYKDVRHRLLERLQRWQTETNDGLANPELLTRLTNEVNECLDNNRRIPAGGWKYADYLAP